MAVWNPSYSYGENEWDQILHAFHTWWNKDVEKSIFISCLDMLFFCFLTCSLSTNLQNGTHCISGKHSFALLLLRTIFAAHWCLLVNASSALLFWLLGAYWKCFAELNTLARVEGGVSNKNGVGFITLFSCLSLLSVI